MKSLFCSAFVLFLSSQLEARDKIINKDQYRDKLQGFWLGQSIANWTGLITEMNKIGTVETLPFYTDQDWGKPDKKAFWGEYVPHASIIGFYFEPPGKP